MSSASRRSQSSPKTSAAAPWAAESQSPTGMPGLGGASATSSRGDSVAGPPSEAPTLMGGASVTFPARDSVAAPLGRFMGGFLAAGFLAAGFLAAGFWAAGARLRAADDGR